MGLDAVELVLATEEEFQIVISDEEAEKCTTPNLLTDLVYSKLRKPEDNVCPSMRGFYGIRKAIINHLGISREKIKIETPLDELIDKSERTKKWQGLLSLISHGQKIHAPLKRPRWVKILMFAFVIIAFFVSAIETEAGMLAVMFASFVWLLLIIITIPLKKEFPSNFQTVKDLIGIIGSLDSKEWNRDKVYSQVISLVSMQMGIKEKDISPDDHFIIDLRMG